MVSFPPWATTIRNYLPLVLLGGGLYTVVIVWFGFSPRTTDVGYAPAQPVPFSHAMHAGELAVDCRYCHTTVETAAHAAIPHTQICMNCHERVSINSRNLDAVRYSFATGEPMRWVRVHDLPDFVYFDHSAHVRRGVGCVSCHGRIDTMERVGQVETLSMGWCLDCHRAPEAQLRPPHLVTRMDWTPEGDREAVGARIREQLQIDPSEDCSTCHR